MTEATAPTYQSTILELTGIDPTEAAETAAESMTKAMLVPSEIEAKMFVIAVRVLSQAMSQRMLRKEAPADVWAAASGIKAMAEKTLLNEMKHLELQHRRFHVPRFTSTHDKPVEVFLMPELTYSVTCDHKNAECLSLAYGPANINTTETEVVAPGSSTTVSGRSSIYVTGGNEPVLFAVSRVGGDVIRGTLAEPLPQVRSKSPPTTTPPTPKTAKPKRKWLW